MVGITQNKQMPYFHYGPQKIQNNKKSKMELAKALKIVKQLVIIEQYKQEQYKLISSTDDN